MTPDTLPPLVLASSSPYRRELLARLGLAFSWAAPNIDETRAPHERPMALVRRLSAAKARAVAHDHSEALVIASDQVAVMGTRVLGKPGARDAAIAQLLAASAQTVTFLTGLCVLDCGSGRTTLEVVTTEVVFRALDPRAIEIYVDAEQPFDCAGSFKAEGLGIALFERITSDDPTALTGLPLIALVSALRACGRDPLASSP